MILALTLLCAALVAALPGGVTPAAAAPTSPGPTATTSESTFTGAPGRGTPTTTGPTPRETVVLLGAPGLRWSDVSRSATPALWRLANDGPVGTMSVRSVLSPTCATDAWLVLSAGRAVSDAPQTPACPDLAEPEGGQVPAWSRYLRQAAAEDGAPAIGTLGERLDLGGRTAAAVGPGAAVAIADGDGHLTGRYLPTSPGYGPAVREALRTSPDLLVVDLGRVWITPERMSRPDQVQQIERAVAQIVPELPPDATVLLTAAAASDRDPRLGMVALSGNDEQGHRYKAGVLGSAEYRQSGLLRGSDVTATVLHLLGLPIPPAVDGAPMRVVGQEGASSEEILQGVADRELATGTVNPLSRWFVGGLLLAQLVLATLAWWALRVRRHHVLVAADDDAAHRSTQGETVARAEELRSVAALRYAALTLGALPIVTFVATLIPWWRSTWPGLALAPVLVALAVAVMSIVLAEPWRRHPTGPAAAVAGITVAVLAADTASGSSLQVNALLGGGQESSGRLDGMSDLGFSLFLAGSLVLATCLAEWLWRTGRGRRAPVNVLVLGLICSLVVALPGLGNNVSGLITMVPGFLLLAYVSSGRGFTWRSLVGATLTTLALVAVLAVADLHRDPARRSRLGRFLAGLMHGGAGEVLARKADAVGRATSGDVLTLAVPLAVLTVLLVLLRPAPGGGRSPLRELSGHRHVITRGSAVLALTLALGAIATDGGGAVPGMGSLLAVPLVLAAVAQQRLEDAGALGTSPLRQRDAAPAHEEAGDRPLRRPAPTWADEARDRRSPLG